MKDCKRKVNIIEVTEKKSLTLEKDKEDQSKFYLSYPKPPVFNMKWENHDINVAEWAKIPKFPLFVNAQLQKKRNVATLNSAHQAKKRCDFDSGWLERQQSNLHSFF